MFRTCILQTFPNSIHTFIMKPSLGVNCLINLKVSLFSCIKPRVQRRTFISCVPCTVTSRDTPTTKHSAAMEYMKGSTVLAVSIGDQAGRRCCMKAELSGLRARGPGVAASLPMRGSPSGGPTGGGGGGGSHSKQDTLLVPVLCFGRGGSPCVFTHCFHSGLCQEIFPAGLALWGQTFETKTAGWLLHINQSVDITSSF